MLIWLNVTASETILRLPRKSSDRFLLYKTSFDHSIGRPTATGDFICRARDTFQVRLALKGSKESDVVRMMLPAGKGTNFIQENVDLYN